VSTLSIQLHLHLFHPITLPLPLQLPLPTPSQLIPNHPHSVTFHPTDVSSFPSLQAAFKSTLATSPQARLDIVIANAGIPGGSLLPICFPPNLAPDQDLPEPSIKTLEVNVVGAYYTTVLALHYFGRSGETTETVHAQQLDQPRGAEVQKQNLPKQLIFLGSLAAYAIPPTALTAAYTLSKFSLRGLFKSIRYASLPDAIAFGLPSIYTQTLPYHLRANMIAPSWVETGMLGSVGSNTSISNVMQEAGLAVASVRDVVDVVMRVACDREVWGRAVGVVPAGSRSGGDAEGFDLRDDPAGGDGGKVVWDVVEKTEVFGKGAAEAVGFGAWV